MAALRFVQTRGTGARFSFNKLEGRILLAERSDGLDVRYVAADAWASLQPGESVAAPLPYEGLMSLVAREAGAYTALIHHVDDGGRVLDELSVELHVLHVRVDVDADRDRQIGENEEGKRNWVWGKGAARRNRAGEQRPRDRVADRVPGRGLGAHGGSRATHAHPASAGMRAGSRDHP